MADRYTPEAQSPTTLIDVFAKRDTPVSVAHHTESATMPITLTIGSVMFFCTVDDAARIVASLRAGLERVHAERFQLVEGDAPFCMGTSEYGHGLTRTIVHADGCCKRAAGASGYGVST